MRSAAVAHYFRRPTGLGGLGFGISVLLAIAGTAGPVRLARRLAFRTGRALPTVSDIVCGQQQYAIRLQ